MSNVKRVSCLLLLCVFSSTVNFVRAEDWLQHKFDQRHSGNVPKRDVETPLKLVGAVPLTDAIFTSPVISDGRIYVVDGSGVAFCIDSSSLEVVWKTATSGGKANCNNVSSPAIVGPNLHFGTMAGSYYVLDRSDGSVVREHRCGGPIYSAPVVVGERAYFATVGAKVFAVDPSGDVQWVWDFVKEIIGLNGDRWNGEAWRQFKKGRVTWRDHFCCSRNIAAFRDTVVIPAGGRTIFLRDACDRAELRVVGEIPAFAGNEYPAAFGQSIGEEGEVYVQWHRRDNAGRVEILRLTEDNQIESSFVPGTVTAIALEGSLSFCSVSVRGSDVFRCRPEEGFGLCRHSAGKEVSKHLDGYPSICSPILLKRHVVHGGLDGTLYTDTDSN